ncbi:hypothetical protein DQW50_03540 [Halorubrum sp. 48-1-W]|uniref:hypothetical protein n=1 Tax=Halorubrum sp. 48-1-W TaxID=2249761 RepID=UPI000DCEDC5A|nr:hypothetical protein [Halorubrum sp. 48-1-W]RAW46456.1 hypothetical protein DQW50_03540 [Halorubrum sp. 48-1-W]
MADPHAATRELLAERPAVEAALESVLAVDGSGPWAFDDVDVDSGTFGELVSRGIVEHVDDDAGDYRVADPAAVRAVLDGEAYDGSIGEDAEGSRDGIGSRIRLALTDRANSVRPTFVAPLLASLVVLVAFRLVTYRSVFREGMVTLPGNDPYHYRHHVDRLLVADPSPFDPRAIADVLGGRATGDPLVYTLGYWVTRLLEPAAEQSGVAIALLPVAAAVGVGVLVAWIGLVVANDERVAVLSVLALAATPAHALYSGVGFFDHHPFDYLWVTAMAAALVWLARDVERRTGDPATENPLRGHLWNPWTWLVASGFGVVVAASMLTWNGAPLLLTGVATYAVFRSGSDLRAGQSPAGVALPLVGGLALGGAITHVIHSSSGWLEPAVAYSPLLVAGGALLVAALGEACRFLGVTSLRAYLGGVGLGGAGLFVGARVVTPDVLGRLVDRFATIVGGARSGIAESRSLLSADYGVVFGSLEMFGWFLVLALPILGWISWRCVRTHEPRWLVLSGFAWPLLGVTLFEIRFAGELSPFTAVFVAVGTLWLLSWIDLAAPVSPIETASRYRLSPDTFRPSSETAYVAGMLLFVASLGILLGPTAMDTVAQTDGQVEAVGWMAEDAATNEPEEFVASRWGEQRFYNYHVFGESDSYRTGVQDDIEVLYASSRPDDEYDRFDSGVGYLVLEELEDVPAEAGPEDGYTRLVERYGSATAGADGVGRYRLRFVSSGGGYLVFTPVPGATINGTGPVDERFNASTDVSVPGASFTYSRHVDPTDNGTYSVRVAHPGTYDVGERGTVTVTEDDIRGGNTVRVGENRSDVVPAPVVSTYRP